MTPRNPIFTAANIVTTIRIILIPVFVFVLMAPWPTWFPYWPEAEAFKPWISAVVYALLAATDGVDGYLARSRNEVTTLGKFLDPLADKILVCAALLALCELGTLPSWIALIIVAREFIISGLRMVASAEGIVIAASWYGKVKTAVTIVAIILFIVKDSSFIYAIGPIFALWFNLFSWFVMIVAVLLTIISMVDYFAKANATMHLFSLSSDNAGEDESIVDASSEHRGDSPVESINDARTLVNLLSKEKLTLATAESCTGGLIGSAITDVSGSSNVYLGGVISYAVSAKESLLKVSPSTVDECGIVSEETAREMAQGARLSLQSSIAISTTGIAGPSGGNVDTPVGTVCFGYADINGVCSFTRVFEGDRAQIRYAAVQTALDYLVERTKHTCQ